MADVSKNSVVQIAKPNGTIRNEIGNKPFKRYHRIKTGNLFNAFSFSRGRQPLAAAFRRPKSSAAIGHGWHVVYDLRRRDLVDVPRYQTLVTDRIRRIGLCKVRYVRISTAETWFGDDFSRHRNTRSRVSRPVDGRLPTERCRCRN